MPQDLRPTPFTVSNIYDTQRQADFQNLDISEGDERGVALEKSLQEHNTLGALQDFAQATYYRATEQKISAQDATKQYGTPGLNFNEPIEPSLAQARRTRFLQSKERNEILASEAADNNLGQNLSLFGTEMLGSVFADPVTYISPLAEAGNLIKGLKGLSLVQKYGVTSKALRYADTTLNDATLLGGAFRTAAARTALDVAIPNLATEYAIYDLSQKNGYDYDLLSSIGYVFLGSAGAGLIGGVVGKAIAKNDSKNFYFLTDHIRGLDAPTPTKAALADSIEFADSIVKNGYISPEILEAAQGKYLGDIAAGRITSMEFTKALFGMDSSSKKVTEFMENLRAGKYSGVIDEDLAKGLLAEDIPAIKKTVNFKSWVINSIDKNLFPGLNYRPLIKGDFIKEYSGQLGSLKQIDELITKLQSEAKAIQSKIGSGAVTNIDGKIQVTRETKAQLKEQFQKAIADVEQAKATKAKFISEKIDTLSASFLKDKDYTKLTSDTFVSDYKKLTNRIKGRKATDIENFFFMSQEGRQDILNLFHMLDVNNIDNLDLSTILNHTDSELRTFHQAKIFNKELSALSKDDALEILKREIQDPEFRVKEQALKRSQEVEDVVKKAEQKLSTGDADIKAEFDRLSKNPEVIKDIELQKELKDLETQIKTETGLAKGEKKAYDCLLGG